MPLKKQTKFYFGNSKKIQLRQGFFYSNIVQVEDATINDVSLPQVSHDRQTKSMRELYSSLSRMVYENITSKHRFASNHRCLATMHLVTILMGDH